MNMTKPIVEAARESAFRVELVSSASGLDRWSAEWDALAAQALVANPFYESWMLRPAFEAFAPAGGVDVAVIHRDDSQGRSLLTGLMPVVRFSRFHGMPCRGLTLWNHLHGVLSTPLLHRDHASQSLGAFLDFASETGDRLIVFDMVDAERSFGQVLTDVLNQRRLMSVVEDQHNRAFFRPRASSEAYLAEALDGRRRQEYRRQRRRLGEQGALETRILRPGDNVEPWLDAFLRLEASGWKGTEATALASRPNERAFFRSIVVSAHAKGRLQMLGLFLSGEPVSIKCNFLAGGGAFSLKIAYDERYAKFSPGVLLEIDTIEAMHQDRDIGWMDSCACANHAMIDRLWIERRALQRRVVSTGSRWGNLVLGLSALGRAIKRKTASRTAAPSEPGDDA